MKSMKKIFVGKSLIHGKGVFAAATIRNIERILEIDDSRAVTEENPLNPDHGELERHCDYLANGRVVLMQPPERYINHFCDPNAYVKIIEGRRFVSARRDIPKGEEITFDYCIDSRGDVAWECNCGSPQCRKTIHSDFFHLPQNLQLEYLPFLSEWFIAENQEKVEELQRRRESLTSAFLKK